MPDWDDTDYAPAAASYQRVRCADPRIHAQILQTLEDARSVINVGAGTGSYEPVDREVSAVEPSAEMRERRAPELAAANACADDLPFPDRSFDAGLAVLTVHHWPDLEAGLVELRRVCRERIVIMTADPDALCQLWVAAYSPQFHAVERRKYPSLRRISDALGGFVEIHPVVIPLDCVDGFVDAFYGRPELMLDRQVREAQSAWSFVSDADQQAFVDRLTTELWSRRSWVRAP